MPTHCTLYRLFDARGELLYLGIAGNPGRRFEQHAKDKPWWTEVDTIKLEHFDHRSTAEAAEIRAIKTERPRHNVVHNNRRKPVRRFAFNPGVKDADLLRQYMADPEGYHALLGAVSDYANSADLGLHDQEEFAQLLANFGRLCCYGDWCMACATADVGDDYLRYPVGCRVSGSSVLCAYRCHACGATWGSHWAINEPLT
jgi:predicted GIY-YIG superfamily endonuclease